jgi:hypothetical protein
VDIAWSTRQSSLPNQFRWVTGIIDSKDIHHSLLRYQIIVDVVALPIFDGVSTDPEPIKLGIDRRPRKQSLGF